MYVVAVVVHGGMYSKQEGGGGLVDHSQTDRDQNYAMM